MAVPYLDSPPSLANPKLPPSTSQAIIPIIPPSLPAVHPGGSAPFERQEQRQDVFDSYVSRSALQEMEGGLIQPLASQRSDDGFSQRLQELQHQAHQQEARLQRRQYHQQAAQSHQIQDSQLLLHHQAVSQAQAQAQAQALSHAQQAQPVLPPPTSLKPFPTGFDDPFPNASGIWEPPPPGLSGPESPTADRDIKLLGFGHPHYNYKLLDSSGRRITVYLNAQLHGMFFLAESPWAEEGETSTPPTELTCYRRNLYQISGSITIPRTLHFIVTEQGERMAVLAQELTVTATESIEGNPVKVISVPWKTPASTVPTADEKVEREPPTLPLDLLAHADVDADYASFPIAWKRLQFRIATANNGRRKELQQHFVIRLRVMATLHTGAKICICEAHSGPIIVRGRSPRNFKSGKDLPLSGSASSSRRPVIQPVVAPLRTFTGGSVSGEPSSVKLSPDESPLRTPPKHETKDLPLSTGFLDWIDLPASQHSALPPRPPDATVPLTQRNPGSAIPSPDAHSAGQPTTSHPTSRAKRRPPPPSRLAISAPIHLSLADDDMAPSQALHRSSTATSHKRPSDTTFASGRAGKAPRLASATPHTSETHTPESIAGPLGASATSAVAAVRRNGLDSPGEADESANLLYEYFPLGLDDWKAPVDAVYRPHVVHHTNHGAIAGEKWAKGRRAGSGNKYFSREGGGVESD